jgi:hypothetical protein
VEATPAISGGGSGGALVAAPMLSFSLTNPRALTASLEEIGFKLILFTNELAQSLAYRWMYLV